MDFRPRGRYCRYCRACRYCRCWRHMPATMPYYWREQVVDAASRPRFLPRDLARADEEDAKAQEPPMISILTAKNAKIAKRRYTGATA